MPEYNRRRFASVAELLSAVLEALVIYLEVMGEEKMSKFVDLLDKIVLALKSSSTAVLFAVDEITSCGPRRRSVCSQARKFCGRIRLAAGVSLGGTVSVASAAYIRRAPAALTLARTLFLWVCCLSRDPPPFIPPRRRSPDPSPPRTPRRPKTNVELQVTGGASPCHPPTGVRLSVSSRYDDEDD